MIDGDPIVPIPIPEELATLNLENIKETTDTFIKNATLPTFAILIIVAVILIFLFLALSKGATIAKTVDKVV